MISYQGNAFNLHVLSSLHVLFLFCRGTFRVDDPDNFEDISDDTVNVRFRHDPRLVLPSFQYHTNEQVSSYWCLLLCFTLCSSQAMSFFENINSKILEVTAEHGWPLSRSDLKRRRDYLNEKVILLFIIVVSVMLISLYRVC